jgi:hypothetical protein
MLFKLMLKSALTAVVIACASAHSQSDRPFLRTIEPYSDIEKLRIQLTCMKILSEERERIKDFQLHQMAQEMNKALNWNNPLDKPQVDLGNLDVFNYSLAGMELDEEKQQIVISVVANQKFVDKKPGAEQRNFLADCFRLISQKLANAFIDFDEYRDFVALFYPLDFEEEPFVEYREGGFVWTPRKQ